MSAIVNEFLACFTGGIGTSGQIRESWTRVRILANGESEFKYMGKLFGRWHKLIPNLDDEQKFPYTIRDLYLGGEQCKTIRMYNFSTSLVPFIQSLEHSSTAIVNKQLNLQLIETKEKLASAQKMLRNLGFEDRRRKSEIDNSKHQKTLRSNLAFSDQVGYGI